MRDEGLVVEFEYVAQFIYGFVWIESSWACWRLCGAYCNVDTGPSRIYEPSNNFRLIEQNLHGRILLGFDSVSRSLVEFKIVD